MKSDQEESIEALINEIGRRRKAEGSTGKILPEDNPVGSSQSNGVIERAVQSIEAQVRVLRSALEERWSVKIEEDARIWTYIIEYAGFLLSRCEVDHDGRTAYERMKGKVATILGLEFGELIMWKRKPTGGRKGKLSP